MYSYYMKKIKELFEENEQLEKEKERLQETLE